MEHVLVKHVDVHVVRVKNKIVYVVKRIYVFVKTVIVRVVNNEIFNNYFHNLSM